MSVEQLSAVHILTDDMDMGNSAGYGSLQGSNLYRSIDADKDIVKSSNYNLLVCSTENNAVLEKIYLDEFISRRISGIILHSTGKIDSYIAQKTSRTIPMVLVYRHNTDEQFVGDTIDTNGRQGAYDLTRLLISEGHRKIGLVNGYKQFSTGRDRLEGYTQALTEAGLIPTEDRIYYGDFTEPSGYDGARQLLGFASPPTSLLCMNNAAAVGALTYLREHNIRVPEDVSFANYGDIDNVDLMWVQPTRIPQNPGDIGRKAGELILDRIKHPERPNREIIFDSGIIHGNSISAPVQE